MEIKALREKLGWSQEIMSKYLNIPKRTIENWESGFSSPPEYVEKLIVEKLQSYLKPVTPKFIIRNESVNRYAEICKRFAEDSKDWLRLPDDGFFTTGSLSDWEETPDNAHDGIDVSWAFKLSETEIEYQAAERLFELLLEEIQVAVDDQWDSESLACTIKKFNLA